MRLTCKEASHLISAEFDGRLGLGRRLALRLHLLACDACVRVKAQMAFLRRAMVAYVNQETPREKN
ncbi:MAG: anti-sigma factor [Betaproteobacteria bacterium]|nr:anti-sigma factor [Betaproteobacteria bacterium]